MRKTEGEGRGGQWKKGRVEEEEDRRWVEDGRMRQTEGKGRGGDNEKDRRGRVEERDNEMVDRRGRVEYGRMRKTEGTGRGRDSEKERGEANELKRFVSRMKKRYLAMKYLFNHRSLCRISRVSQ